MCKDGMCGEFNTTETVTVTLPKVVLLDAAGALLRVIYQGIDNDKLTPDNARKALEIPTTIIQSMATKENDMSKWMTGINSLRDSLGKQKDEDDILPKMIVEAFQNMGYEVKVIAR